ncbi:hypothetical protein EMN47_03730 [Prolixibacteraceae bacterium JC049]|nr:hypothetical protein [Prolixibacteraceae bacterium JC049]
MKKYLLIGTILIVAIIFIANHKKEDKRNMQSANYKSGKFHNLEETKQLTEFSWSMLKESFAKNNKRPSKELPMQKVSTSFFQSPNLDDCKVIWLGHSALIIQIEGKHILLDPMLGDNTMPVPFKRGARFNEELPIDIDQLSNIDLAIISHNHYDHMDKKTIKRLAHKITRFAVPLGVDKYLQKWGIEKQKISALDWWESVEINDLKIVATPSRHFSGRGLFDSNESLWASWVIQSKKHNLYFSGDSGYGKHFKQIGEKYGPFDFAMLECGQYDRHWNQIHMLPKQTVQAAIDLKSKRFMPIHWGVFQLANHSWDHPVETAFNEAQRKNVSIIVPQMGEIVDINQASYANKLWWRELQPQTTAEALRPATVSVTR